MRDDFLQFSQGHRLKTAKSGRAGDRNGRVMCRDRDAGSDVVYFFNKIF